MTRLAGLFISMVVAGAIVAAAPQPPGEKPPGEKPPGEKPAGGGPAERGRRAFTRQCSFCHGVDARGGAQGGSDLLLSPIVLEDQGGRQLAQFLKVGRPEKNMPKFDLPRAQVSDLAAFLHGRVAAAAKSDRSAARILVGDPAAGAAYFNGTGGCAACHSVTGDLKGIASRYDPVMLQGRMVVPRGKGGWPGGDDEAGDKPLRATVTPASGASLSGDVVYLSDFYLTLKDASGRHRTVIRRPDVKVEIVDPLHAHVALLRTLTDRDMHNLTAYLATLK